MIKKFFKTFLFILIVFTYIPICYLLNLIVRNKRKRLWYSAKLTSIFCSFLLKTIRYSVTTRNIKYLNENNDKTFLVLSNHLSYTDIFVISSISPSLFIASVDGVKNQFLLGMVTQLSGSFFVERRNRSRLSADMKNIVDKLICGLDVVLFPEGTTSNGDSILPFKAPFISCAGKANVDVLPICIKYTKVNGVDIDNSTRDSVYYYGDAAFFEHFFRMISLNSVDVEVTELEKISVDAKSTRKDITNMAYERINEAYLNN